MSKVTSVRVAPSLCPLVDALHKPRDCYYSMNEQTLWESSRPAPVLPVALSPDTALLKVTVATPGTYQILAQINHENVIPQPAIVTFTGAPSSLNLVFPRNRVPYSFRGSLQWTLTDVSSKAVHTTSMDVEIHILYPRLPRCLDIAGIPLSLLRMEPLMSNWKASAEPDWAKFVVSQLHGERRLEYDTWKGVSTYTSNPSDIEATSSLGVEIRVCWLDLWLSDMEGLRVREDKGSKYGVNCYDMTALAQVIISLGTDYAPFRMKYMEPVGYIRDTILVGYTDPPAQCNNPYFGSPGRPKSMQCDPRDGSRSKVANHTFLTHESGGAPNVFDACCGPQTGASTLWNYPGILIDTQKPASDPESSGTLASIYDGPGVREIAVSAFFDRDSTGWLGSETLLGRLKDYLNGGGTVQDPYVGCLPDTGAAAATLTFNPENPFDGGKPRADIWTINVMRFKTADEVRIAYMERRDAIAEPVELSGNELINLQCRGGFTMFYDADACVLSIIESRIVNSTFLGGLRAKMRTYIGLMNRNQDAVVETSVHPQLPIIRGHEFPLVIRPLHGTSKKWFAGYSVSTSFGNAFLLRSNINDIAEITFTFLARRSGADNISVTLYGADLNQEAAITCAVYIRDT